MPNAKQIHCQMRIVAGLCVSILLALTSLAQSQTPTPETQPTPEPVSPALPSDSTIQPSPAASPAEFPTPVESSAPPASPLIPPATGPGALPSPSPKPTLPPQTVQALDQQFQDALQIRRVHPKELVFFSLMDAIRIALYPNPDVRLAVEDAQLAKGSLVKATGDFHSKLLEAVGYAKSYTNPAEGQAATP